VIGGLWIALQNPVLFLIALALFIAVSVWLLPKIWRGLKRVFNWLRRKLGGATESVDAVTATGEDG